MKYCDNFFMHFCTGTLKIEWQRLKVGIAPGCTISVILFDLVMEMILESTDVERLVEKAPLKSFMDDTMDVIYYSK